MAAAKTNSGGPEGSGAGGDASAGLAAIFWSFVKMGAVLIGGGYALLPLLEREIVMRRKWARSEEMLDLYALAQVLPGVIAVNTAMLVGNRLRGLAGTLVAAAGLTLAPFLMIAAYASAYGSLRDTSVFSKALSGVQPAVAGMILGLGTDMVRKLAAKPEGNRPGAARRGIRANTPLFLAAASAAVMMLFNPSFGWLVAFAIAAGLAIHAFRISAASSRGAENR